MFVKLTTIDKNGATLAEIWVSRTEIRSMQRVSANADYVDHTRVVLSYTADGQQLTLLASETPAQVAPTLTEDGRFRS